MAFRPMKEIEFGASFPMPIGRSSENSVKGRRMLRAICQTPLVPRSQRLKDFFSASRRKRDGTAFDPFRSGAAPMMRELAAEPLIWSFTEKLQVVLVPEVFSSGFSTTARTKFFC